MDNNARANDLARKASRTSPEVQYAITQVLPNISNGAFWGFTDLKSTLKHTEQIKKSGGNIIARQLDNACLIEVSPQFLIQNLAYIDSTILNKKVVDDMVRMRAEATVEMERFLISRCKLSSEFIGTIGIYCINDTPTISYKGRNFPAFRVDMQTTLALFDKYEYRIRMNGQFLTPTEISNANKMPDLWKNLFLSPTKTGLFMDVKSPTPNTERVKALEKEFLARYSK